MVNVYNRLVATICGLSSLAQLAVAATFSSTGQTVVLDGTSYYVPPSIVATISASDFSPLKGVCGKSGGLLPLTVIKTGSLGYSAKELSLDLSLIHISEPTRPY